MEYLLIDKNPEMVLAWIDFFDNEPDVQISEGDLTEVNCDAIVSPANSFGFMDGGVDYAISTRLGWDLQDQLQTKIKALPEGELLIGQSMLLETGDDTIPFLIASPTMRVPMSFQIATSINAYLAMKATLIMARSHPQIKRVAIPGFCTGVGRMPVEISAKQMHIAYEEIVKEKKMDFKEFGEAQKYHWNINNDGLIYDY